MIKLFSLKQQKRDGEAGKPGTKRASAAQLRVQKGGFGCLKMRFYVISRRVLFFRVLSLLLRRIVFVD